MDRAGLRQPRAASPATRRTFAASYCQQAYRWNLDYVVDRHGNTMSLFYDTETNNYARNVTATKVSSYVRAGNLTADRVRPARRRGLHASRRSPGSSSPPPSGASPAAPARPASPPTTRTRRWTRRARAAPTATTSSTRPSGPRSGWRRSPPRSGADRRSRRSTPGRCGTRFPDPGDGTRAGLWLEAITNSRSRRRRRGHCPRSTSTASSCPTGWTAIDGIPPMNWWRISAVHYGTGGELAVAYSAPDCSAAGQRAGPGHQRQALPPGRSGRRTDMAERQDWFNKYVVTEVTESDRVSGLEPVVTKVEYLVPAGLAARRGGRPGRDRPEDLVAVARLRTGPGHQGSPERVRSRSPSTAYFRGMDGDKLADGGQKDVHVTDSTGARVEDVNPLAGQVRETDHLRRLAMVVERSITDHWVSRADGDPGASAGAPPRPSRSRTQAIRQDEAVDTGWRNEIVEEHLRRRRHDDRGGRLERLGQLRPTTPARATTYAANPAAGSARAAGPRADRVGRLRQGRGPTRT